MPKLLKIFMMVGGSSANMLDELETEKLSKSENV
jgi:hypothetical protein